MNYPLLKYQTYSIPSYKPNLHEIFKHFLGIMDWLRSEIGKIEVTGSEQRNLIMHI